jgi:hypothetical protein
MAKELTQTTGPHSTLVQDYSSKRKRTVFAENIVRLFSVALTFPLMLPLHRAYYPSPPFILLREQHGTIITL